MLISPIVWVLRLYGKLIRMVFRNMKFQRFLLERRKRINSGLRYISVSPHVLCEWLDRDPNLIIVDLHGLADNEAGLADVPMCLQISKRDLPKHLLYLPLRSRLVLWDTFADARLSTEAENILLMIGIRDVYIYEGNTLHLRRLREAQIGGLYKTGRRLS
jgi:hypothetical protein